MISLRTLCVSSVHIILFIVSLIEFAHFNPTGTKLTESNEDSIVGGDLLRQILRYVDISESSGDRSEVDSATSEVSSKTSPQKEDFSIEEHQLRLEFIKIQILHKLGLNKAPKIRRKHFDQTAYSQLLELQQLQLGNSNQFQAIEPSFREENQYEQSNVNLPPEENDKLFLMPIKRGPYSATFNLTFDTSIHRYPIRKITMFTKMRASHDPWDKDITLILLKGGINSTYESFLGKASPLDGDGTSPLHYTESDLFNDLRWKEYDLTHLISREKSLPYEERLIVVDTDQRKLHSSFLTIEFDYLASPRKKRRIDCNSAGNTSFCCRETFYVNFTEIGWDHWIVQPKGYFANYCKGKCDIANARYHHTTVIHKYSSLINLCCSPREMSNMSLLYVDDKGYFFQKTLPNMVVESCDCA